MLGKKSRGNSLINLITIVFNIVYKIMVQDAKHTDKTIFYSEDILT